MAKPSRERFDQLRQRWQRARDKHDDLRLDLRAAYSQIQWAPESKQKRLRELSERESKAAHAFVDYVNSISPRSWSSGVSMYWIIQRLTFDDATTRGQLADFPEPSYGASLATVRALMMPV